MAFSKNLQIAWQFLWQHFHFAGHESYFSLNLKLSYWFAEKKTMIRYIAVKGAFLGKNIHKIHNNLLSLWRTNEWTWQCLAAEHECMSLWMLTWTERSLQSIVGMNRACRNKWRVLVTCCGGQYGLEMSRIPHFLDNRFRYKIWGFHGGDFNRFRVCGEFVSLNRRQLLIPNPPPPLR
jgi:hypothetical protein